MAWLKRKPVAADLGDDVNVRPDMSLLVQGRRESDFSGIGASRFSVDYVEG